MKKRRTQAAKRQPSPLHSLSDKSAVLAFIVLLVVIIFLLDSAGEQKISTSPEDDAETIFSRLLFNSTTSTGLGFVVTASVDQALFDSLANDEYGEIKRDLGVQNDFIIHFEDDEGNLIPIGERLCIGPATAKVRGMPCDTLRK